MKIETETDLKTESLVTTEQLLCLFYQFVYQLYCSSFCCS